MQIVKGFYDNGVIVLDEKMSSYRYKGEIAVIFPAEIDSEKNNKRAAFLGCMKEQGWIADDFDEPLEEMKEYMY